jgi:DNA-nicking Smr family endonuclease
VSKKKNLSQKDRSTWEDYIKNPSDVYDKDQNTSNKQERKSRFKFDLHGFTLDKANLKVREIIFYCVENKYKEILLVTGKGIHSTNENDSYVSKDLGKLKFSVPDFINTDEELKNNILSIDNADIKDGGEGAILIKLRNL